MCTRTYLRTYVRTHMRSDGGARKSVSRMTGKLGLSNRAVHKLSGRHLPYDHSAMVAVRQWVNLQVTMQHIHPKLMCHFDQVWTTHHTPVQKALIKTGEKCKLKPTAFRMLQGVRAALGLEVEPNPAKEYQGPAQATLSATSTLTPVDYSRHDCSASYICTYVRTYMCLQKLLRRYVRTCVPTLLDV